MQAIFETVFDAVYLSFAISVGVLMIKEARDNKAVFLFGLMALILGVGDSFHLIPRAYALLTSGLKANYMILGFGKMITSITMTAFYVLLFEISQMKYKSKRKYIKPSIYLLTFVRVVLSLMPQNNWTAEEPSLLFGVLRNIPFAIMGVIIILIFFNNAKDDKIFKYMWLAITLSFAFYIPVVLFADSFPAVGLLMIPKTLAYVWVVYMGYKFYKEEKLSNENK